MCNLVCLLEGIHILMTNQISWVHIHPQVSLVLLIKALVAVIMLCFTVDVTFPRLHLAAGFCSLQFVRKTTFLPVLLMFISVLRSVDVVYCSEFNLDFQELQFFWWKLKEFKVSCKKFFFFLYYTSLFSHFHEFIRPPKWYKSISYLSVIHLPTPSSTVYTNIQ